MNLNKKSLNFCSPVISTSVVQYITPTDVTTKPFSVPAIIEQKKTSVFVSNKASEELSKNPKPNEIKMLQFEKNGDLNP
jgi:Na+-transporting NADH:ubiquinone oxidoreductase subunit NqrA